MNTTKETRRNAGLIALALGTACSMTALTLMARTAEIVPEPAPGAKSWLDGSFNATGLSPVATTIRDQQAALRQIVATRTAEDLARYRWWATGGPAHRWNELMLQEMQDSFVVLPMAARHLALLHVAIDDAVSAARSHRGRSEAKNAAAIDSALDTRAGNGRHILTPSRHAAAAAAASDVMAYIFPARAAHFAAKAEEAMQARVLGGVELPYEITLGRELGKKVAALAIARGRSDGSDAKWTGTVPDGTGMWKGTNPVAPAAATWRTWVLASPSELRPPPPPAVGSDQAKTDLAELKSFARTPKSNHRAVYWEVHGGARAHTLWNEITRTKLLEHGYAEPVAARVMAAVNVALADAGVACWDAKFTYWYIRPSQLDPQLNPLFPPPNHPSFPAAHGCFSTAAAAVLARVFPMDADRLLALGKEAAEARIWAGIHYRFDIEAGQEIGRKVAEKTLARAFATPVN